MYDFYSAKFKQELEEAILEELKKMSIDWGTGLHPTQLPGDDYSALDIQVGGDHYKKLKIQPIEYILANDLGFCEGNIVKYITRWKDKGGVEDLKKIKHFCDFLIEQDNL